MNIITKILMTLALVTFLATGISLANTQNIAGINGVSVEGSAGVSSQSFVGRTMTLSTAVKGTGASVSIGCVSFNGTAIGTSASGSISTGTLGNATMPTGTGTFRAGAKGNVKATSGFCRTNTAMSGTYSTSSVVTVGN